MKIKQVTTKACETIYEVASGGSKEFFRLFCIVNGTLSISFQDHSYAERFNEWSVGKGEYLDDHYFGQKPQVDRSSGQQYFQGPTIDDLDGGMEAFKAYYKRVIGKKSLLAERLQILQDAAVGCGLRSRRMIHADYHIQFFATLDLGGNGYISKVFFDTGKTNKLVEHQDVMDRFGHPLWAKLMILMAKVSHVEAGFRRWEDVPQHEFDEIVDVIRRIVKAKQALKYKSN